MPTIHHLIKIILTAIIIFPATAHTSDLKSDTLITFLENEHTPPLSLLPENFIITDTFRPGTLTFAGTVTHIQGNAYVCHQESNVAYRLKRDHPVFNGDTLVTDTNARVTLHLADDSTVILTPQSKLLIDRSLPRVKVRDTRLRLFFGKIRSLVKKITGEYTIKTPTASIGVRGTDFAVAVAPAPSEGNTQRWQRAPAGLLTAVLTGGGHSTVEITGLFGPPVMVKPLSAAGVYSGGRAQEAVSLGPLAPFLLQKIAPRGEVVQKKTHPGTCWTFSVDVGGIGKKEYFEVCTPAKQPGFK
jgi:hypothetical protein